MAHERLTNSTQTTGRWPHSFPTEVWGPTTAGGNRPPPRPAPARAPRSAEEAAPAAGRFRSVLVPLDGTPFGEHALPYALGVARRCGARVRLVHVQSPPELAFLGLGRSRDAWGGDGWRRPGRQDYLDGLVRRLGQVADVPVTPVLLERREVVAALRAEAAAKADLVVMATHRRGRLTRLFHNGVANDLLPHLRVPLLLVRGAGAPADLTGDPLLRHVVVALDGSGGDERAVGPAAALAGAADAALTLLRVLRLRPDCSLAAGGWPPPRPRLPSPQAEAWRYLGRLADRLEGRGQRVATRVVVDELPAAAALLDYARRYDADLIALAADGRGAAARLFGGGVADQVIRDATVPVLVVPPGRGELA